MKNMVRKLYIKPSYEKQPKFHGHKTAEEFVRLGQATRGQGEKGDNKRTRGTSRHIKT